MEFEHKGRITVGYWQLLGKILDSIEEPPPKKKKERKKETTTYTFICSLSGINRL